jgi:hypothetical protein
LWASHVWRVASFFFLTARNQICDKGKEGRARTRQDKDNDQKQNKDKAKNTYTRHTYDILQRHTPDTYNIQRTHNKIHTRDTQHTQRKHMTHTENTEDTKEHTYNTQNIHKTHQ